MTPYHRAGMVKQRALDLGFQSVGITDLSPVPHRAALRRWLDRGMAATPPPPGGARVAKYARGPDYHASLVKPMQQLADFIANAGGGNAKVRWYVDAGPVPERELAQRAGLGWIGKNTMLIDPSRGSFLFLAVILTDADLAVDPPFDADRCGSCRRCLEACPTQAFADERVLDSRLCISYWTIEHSGDVPSHLRLQFGDWLFGCDVCQDVCPWNHKFAAEQADPVLALESARAFEDASVLATMDDQTFESQYCGSPFERPGAAGIRRNASIVRENLSQEPHAGHS
jgi:epoxyqueuosine reductase